MGRVGENLALLPDRVKTVIQGESTDVGSLGTCAFSVCPSDAESLGLLLFECVASTSIGETIGTDSC